MFEAETKRLHELVKAVLPELDGIVGWEQGFDALHATPVFVNREEDVHRLMWSPLCVHNLSGYLVKTPPFLPRDEGRKVGICVKGCDSRSLVALEQEKFLGRDRLHIFGIPCEGTVDWRRVMKKIPLRGVSSVRREGPELKVEDSRGVHSLPWEESLARRCLRCAHPNPLVHDVLVRDPVEPRIKKDEAYGLVEEMDQKSLEERLAFWSAELDRCIRCYACRNACPLCVCQDRCIVETRDPKWLTQKMGISEKFMFHMIHSLHLAGRCTECGECERVCPMEIPVTLMKEKLNQITREILGYEAGIDSQLVPPLLTFNPGEHEL